MKLFTSPLLAFLVVVDSVQGHGQLNSPRSRNYDAAINGSNPPVAGIPPIDYCPHCLNVNNKLCGFTSYNDYDDAKDSTGKFVVVCGCGLCIVLYLLPHISGDLVEVTSILLLHLPSFLTLYTRICPPLLQANL